MTDKKKLLFIAMAVVILTAVFAPDALRSISSGGDTLSVGQAYYVSSDPFFNGPVQVLNIVVNGAGNSWSGKLDPNLIKSFSGHALSGDYTLGVERLEESCESSINEEEHEINSYSTWAAPLVKACYNSPSGNPWGVGSSCSYGGRSGGVVTKTWIDSGKTCNYHADCTFVNANRVATGYYLDPTTTYYNKIKVTLFSGGKNYSVILDPNNLEGSIPEVMRVKFLGSFMGQQSCPAISSNFVVYRKANTNTLEIRNKYTFENARGQCSFVNPNNYQSCNGAVNVLDSEVPMNMQSCEVVNWTSGGATAKIKCSPASPVTLPVLQLYLPDSGQITTKVPVGKPSIVSITTGRVEAADFAHVLVDVKNTGEDASFDVALDCGRLSPTSKRVNLMAGEEQIVELDYNGAGIIEKCTVEMTDVNNAANRDVKEATIDITPYCDRTCNPGQEIFYTREYGCWCGCANEYTTNVFEGDCSAIDYSKINAGETQEQVTEFGYGAWVPLGQCPHEPTHPYHAFQVDGRIYSQDDYESLGLTGGTELCWEPNVTGVNTITRNDYLKGLIEFHKQERHCIGIGKYRGVGSYLRNGLTFIPENKAHKVWLPAPVCNYADEYGWNDGVQIFDDFQFQYGAVPNVGVSEEPEYAVEPFTSSPIANVVAELPSVQNVENSVESAGIPCWPAFFAVLLIGGAYWYFYMRK